MLPNRKEASKLHTACLLPFPSLDSAWHRADIQETHWMTLIGSLFFHSSSRYPVLYRMSLEFGKVIRLLTNCIMGLKARTLSSALCIGNLRRYERQGLTWRAVLNLFLLLELQTLHE